MLNFYKFIEILASLQSLVITTMLPVYIPLRLMDKTSNSIEIPITWQIPTIILLTCCEHLFYFQYLKYQLFLLMDIHLINNQNLE